ncbi:response regulator [Phenylobacterium sp. J367]|uniref:response regulator n=1 Tax=Phenylobacterium sp. J367 TaxID=2898435 RepID=UPI0021516020|nr:response regulator [Phenylobacterium sp. J367]MCR5879407.1 response regulator [Phenylobacterium sp. J367]
MPHILLVEDLTSEREMISAALEQRGAQVTAVADDEQAYTALREAASRTFDALVTDINLGHGTTGFDVARAARAIQPGLAVIYMTAFEMETAAHAVEDSLTLRKPLKVSDLAEHILGHLDAETLARGWDGGSQQASAG